MRLKVLMPMVMVVVVVVVAGAKAASVRGLQGRGPEEDAPLEDLGEDVPLSLDLEEEPPRLDLEVEPPFRIEERGAVRPWPNAVVPYAVWGSDDAKQKVKAALNNIEQNTCVNFTARAGQARYLLIKEGDGGCWTSSLGFPSSYERVTINLGPGCVNGGTIKHEVLHALGFPHEQSRPDRNDHVAIKWGNIMDGASSQFTINERYPSLGVPYDLNSIMHYGKHAFAKDPSKPTIVPSPWVDGALGNSNLSWRDKRKVNLFYNCPT